MKRFGIVMTFKIVLCILDFYFQRNIERERRIKGITPTLPPPEERAEIRRKMDEDKMKFREKQRQIRQEYFEKIKAEKNS